MERSEIHFDETEKKPSFTRWISLQGESKMPAKVFNSILVNNTLWQPVVTGRPGHESVITVNVSNHNVSDALISIALTVSASLPMVSAKDVLFLDQIVYARNTRQFPGLILPENITLAVKSDIPNISVLVYGYEEEI